MKQEVEKWRFFGHLDGDICDLLFFDAYQAVYVQHYEGKEPLEYCFWVIYFFYCFTKDYEHQTNEEKQLLMYYALKEFCFFCQHCYNLARTHLKRTILALPESNVIYAGYGSYAVIEVDLDGGDKAFYFVAFRAFREKKKLCLHVTSAYFIFEKQKGKLVKFFIIAYNLLRNKQLFQLLK